MADCDKLIPLGDINISEILSNFDSVYRNKFPDFYIPRKVLPNTKLTPFLGKSNPFSFNEYSISKAKDRIHLGTIPEFKVFNCGLCYLTQIDDVFKNINTVFTDGRSSSVFPTYTKVVENPAGKSFCYQTAGLIISMTTPIFYYKHALVTSSEHVNTYCLYTVNVLFESIFYLLGQNDKLISFHNGSFGSDQPHFHVHLSNTENFVAAKITDGKYILQDYPFESKIQVGIIDEPVQKGIFFSTEDINSLFQTVNRIYTKLYKDQILDLYHLVSSLFVRNGKFIMALFLFSREGKGVIPHAGLISITDPETISDDPSKFNGMFKVWDNDFIIPSTQTFNIEYSFLSDPNDFFDSPIVLSSFLAINENYRESILSKIDFIEIFDNFIVPKIYKILNEDFYKRNNYYDYMRYKIILAIFFSGKDKKAIENMNEIEKIRISNLIQIEIKYSAKLYGLNTSLSFLKGDALSELIEMATDNNFFYEMVEVDKRIGASSAYGQAYKTTIQDIGDSMIKFTLNNEGAYIEYLNGKETNKLRSSMPHFMYVYGILQCFDEIIKKPDGSISLKNVKLCKPDLSINICDMNNTPSSDITCLTKNSYIFVELLEGGISMEKFIQNIDPSNMQDTQNFFSVVTQISLALKIAQEKIGFIHNDLHLNNVLLMPNPNTEKTLYSYLTQNGNKYNVQIYDWIPVIIDPGNSRTNATESLVKEFWDKKLANNPRYYRELSWFHPDSDILTMLLTIKTYWYIRFYNSSLSFQNAIPIVLKNPSFDKYSPIDIFLDNIIFRTGMQVNYQATRQDGGIRNWSFIVKDYPTPGNQKYKGLEEIIKFLMSFQHYFRKKNFNLVFDWGYYTKEKLGPETEINPKNKLLILKLKNYMKKYMEIS